MLQVLNLLLKLSLFALVCHELLNVRLSSCLRIAHLGLGLFLGSYDIMSRLFLDASVHLSEVPFLLSTLSIE